MTIWTSEAPNEAHNLPIPEISGYDTAVVLFEFNAVLLFFLLWVVSQPDAFFVDDQNLKKREEKRIKIGIDESKMTSAVLTN